MRYKCSCLFGLCVVLGSVVCGCVPSNDLSSVLGDSAGDYSEEALTPTVMNVSIDYLKSLYNGNSYHITQDFAIEGVITANDAYGEFPTSLIIEDESGAIEIMCDFGCATSGFIFGATVRVLCSGLWLGLSGGTLAVGGAPQGQDATSQLSEAEASTCMQLSDDEYITPQPVVMTLGNISSAHILRYVVIENLWFEESGVPFCSRNAESGLTEYTSHRLWDMWGRSITLNVDRNVRYADEDVPEGLVSIYAIVEYFGGEYRLRITNCGYRD